MKEGYIPRDQRKTILMLSDDIRTHSGVGNMAREIITNSAHHFNWINLGGAVKHPNVGEGFDLSDEVNKITGLSDASVKVICTEGYGNPHVLRELLAAEKPDAIVHFTDPRYWVWLYKMEKEIRQQCPLVFYTIWDDLPYPMYNKNFYRSDDMLLGISKQSVNIVKNVLKDHPKPEWAVKYVPHGIDEKVFFPVINDFKFEAFKENILDNKEYDFVVLWNSRNIRRKNPSDIILAWRTFLDQLPVEKAKKCILLMKTEPIFEQGTDLPIVIEQREKIVKSMKRLGYEYVTIDLEGFRSGNLNQGLL